MQEDPPQIVQSVEIEARIIRADGSIEDLGVIASSEQKAEE